MSALDETARRSIGSTLVVALALWTSACFSEGPVLPGGDDDDDAADTRDPSSDDDDDDDVTSGDDDDDDDVTSGDDDDDDDATSDDDDDDATSDDDDDATTGDDDDDDDDATSGDDDDDATDTGGPGSCGGLDDCLECFQCVAGPMEACGQEGSNCAETNGCMIVSQCLAGCTAGGLCLDDCCIGHSNAAVNAALALDACQQEACVADPCSDYSQPQCG